MLVNLCLCVTCASALVYYKVKCIVYITLEMAEERIAERIDANLLDVTTDDLHALPKQMY